jgi:hypothetical protein
VQQLAARGQAEPAAREAEGLAVLILRCAFRGQIPRRYCNVPNVVLSLPYLVACYNNLKMKIHISVTIFSCHGTRVLSRSRFVPVRSNNYCF